MNREDTLKELAHKSQDYRDGFIAGMEWARSLYTLNALKFGEPKELAF